MPRAPTSQLARAAAASRLRRAQARAEYRLGALHDRNHREAEAIPRYRRALRLGLDQATAARARAWLASSLWKTGRTDAGRREVRTAMRLAKDPALRKFLRGLARRIEKSTGAKPLPRASAIHCAHPRLRYSPAALRRCLAVLEAQPGACPPAGELSLAFLSDEALARLHGQFLGDPTLTDVITFPGDADGVAGEICVSVDRATAVARARRQPFARELTLYVIHGWLHLAGLDDLTPAGRRAMRRAERRLLAALSREDALPDFRLAR